MWFKTPTIDLAFQRVPVATGIDIKRWELVKKVVSSLDWSQKKVDKPTYEFSSSLFPPSLACLPAPLISSHRCAHSLLPTPSSLHTQVCPARTNSLAPHCRFNAILKALSQIVTDPAVVRFSQDSSDKGYIESVLLLASQTGTLTINLCSHLSILPTFLGAFVAYPRVTTRTLSRMLLNAEGVQRWWNDECVAGFPHVLVSG